MKKVVWLLLFAALVACGPSAADPQLADPDVEEETAVSASDEAAETVEESADTAEAGSDTDLSAATNLDNFVPATTVEEAAVVREQDWLKGATDPLVVLIEYGDFQ